MFFFFILLQKTTKRKKAADKPEESDADGSPVKKPKVSKKKGWFPTRPIYCLRLFNVYHGYVWLIFFFFVCVLFIPPPQRSMA